LPALRTLVVAGEACSADLAARWSRGRRFVNAYGPTEVTVCAASEVYTKDGLPPSIGRPLANTRVYLLNDYMEPVPVGVPGEIYVGGIGVTRGYLNLPDLTEARFVHDPFRKSSSERLYRTGDVGKFREDGRIDFLGRVDHQVKIRG